MITEVERVACTMLYNAIEKNNRVEHPELRQKVEAIGKSDDPELAIEILIWLNKCDRQVRKFIDTQWSEDSKIRARATAYSEAVIRLAGALCIYRLDGKPEGDQQSSIGGEFVITSSLAAACAEYCENVQGAIYELFCD